MLNTHRGHRAPCNPNCGSVKTCRLSQGVAETHIPVPKTHQPPRLNCQPPLSGLASPRLAAPPGRCLQMETELRGMGVAGGREVARPGMKRDRRGACRWGGRRGRAPAALGLCQLGWAAGHGHLGFRALQKYSLSVASVQRRCDPRSGSCVLGQLPGQAKPPPARASPASSFGVVDLWGPCL